MYVDVYNLKSNIWEMSFVILGVMVYFYVGMVID